MTARPSLVAALALVAACHREVADQAGAGVDEDRRLNEDAAALGEQADGEKQADRR